MGSSVLDKAMQALGELGEIPNFEVEGGKLPNGRAVCERMRFLSTSTSEVEAAKIVSSELVQIWEANNFETRQKVVLN